MKNGRQKIILSGGGTGGSVSPLLAVADHYRQQALGNRQNFSFFWVGTRKGPERQMVEKEGIKFKAITSGKLRRYWSWQNLIDPFKILIGFFESIFIIIKEKPGLVMSAGGFVSVPLVFAAWLFRVPIVIHQQDIRPGLANKLMAPLAQVITVTFEESLKDYGKKAVWVGNPIRLRLMVNRQPASAKASARQADSRYFSLNGSLPVVLVVGGGTGSEVMNELIMNSLGELVEFCQVIHICGRDRGKVNSKQTTVNRYFSYGFLDVNQMAEALQMASIVVSRAGLGLLTELSVLGKPSIIIPMPDSHQEDNAKILADKNAAIVLDQADLTKDKFIDNIKKLLEDKTKQRELSGNISKVIKKGAGEKIVSIILDLLG